MRIGKVFQQPSHPEEWYALPLCIGARFGSTKKSKGFHVARKGGSTTRGSLGRRHGGVYTEVYMYPYRHRLYPPKEIDVNPWYITTYSDNRRRLALSPFIPTTYDEKLRK